MRKFLAISITVATLCGIATSCTNDEDLNKENTEQDAQQLDYTEANAVAWGNYARNVALLLQNDANTLLQEWENGFADDFKNHTTVSGYSSAINCVEEILNGSINIANEVGTAKIGEPVDYWHSGQKTQALYAVESWYSWHSRDDYKNNILSIAFSLLGENIGYDSNPSRFNIETALYEGKLNTHSVIAKCIQNSYLREYAIDAWKQICNTWTAIDIIPQPFRNNIDSNEASAAMDACAELVNSLEILQSHILNSMSEEDAQEIVTQFVDYVVMPTYRDLAKGNQQLLSSVSSLQASPSNASFEEACHAWLEARRPWEAAESFLFGPVSKLGLDPNMDSWPLDAAGIAQVLKSGDNTIYDWSGEYNEDDPSIEAAQALRGYHTLEFLLFKDGQPRKVK